MIIQLITIALGLVAIVISSRSIYEMWKFEREYKKKGR
ncbi:Uncharacterised protein [Citrobacter koseri]|nr:Uncharacterised protein [Citrobacter koseri]STB49031.1 Uncharacterised protein [Citrobacter koseri]